MVYIPGEVVISGIYVTYQNTWFKTCLLWISDTASSKVHGKAVDNGPAAWVPTIDVRDPDRVPSSYLDFT